MNTTIVDGVEIKQGDEVEISNNGTYWSVFKFICELPMTSKKTYVCMSDIDNPIFVENIRPISKKQRVPLSQEDIIKKYWNGAVMFKPLGKKCIYKITAITTSGIFTDMEAQPHSLNRLMDEDAEITSGPDSNGVIVWDPCWKEV